MFKGNQEYQQVFELKQEGKDSVCFYTPVNIAEGYHVSRYVAAQAQSMYASSGITPEILFQLMQRIKDGAEDAKKNKGNYISDTVVIANNIQYRTKYPIDEDICLRMSAIYLFMEGENPDKVDDAWTKRKVTLAKDNPDLYTFFLTMGINATPRYRELSKALSSLGEYFQTRSEALKALTPILSIKK